MALVEIADVKKFLGTPKRFCLTIDRLEIAKGEFFTVVGPSGAGKSTLILMLGGFLTPDQGSIKVGKKSAMSHFGSDRFIRTVFQENALFPHLTVCDQLRISAVLSHRYSGSDDVLQAVDYFINALELKGKEDSLPSQLSGGQKRRLALGRAMIARPKLLLLDEPLTAVPGEMREDLLNLMDTIFDEKTPPAVVVVTHDADLALSRSDRIAVLISTKNGESEEGEFKRVGTPEDVYSSPSSMEVAGLLGGANTLVLDSTTFVVRPEQIALADCRVVRPDVYCEEAIIKKRIYRGYAVDYVLEWRNGETLSHVTARALSHDAQQQYCEGSTVWFAIGKRNLKVVKRPAS